MGLGIWTTVEGIVYPSAVRYGGGFEWMVVNDDRKTANRSILRIRPYIKKIKSVSDAYAAFNLGYQSSYFTINDANKKTFNTAFDFREATVGALYPLSASYPFKTNAATPYVEYVINHDENGMATVKIGGYIKGEASSSYFQYVKTTQTITLPKIDRASVLSAVDTAGIGDTIPIYVTKASADDVNTIRYSFGSASGIIADMSPDTQFEWSIPSELTAQIPNAASGICTLMCETYSATELIGTSTKEFTLTVTGVPTFTPSVTADGGNFIRNVSTVNTAFIKAEPTPDAELLTYMVSDGTTTFTGPESTAQFVKARSDTYIFTLIDSRGLSAQKAVYVQEVIPYELPAIGRADYERDIETGNVSVNFSGQWYGGVFADIDNTAATVYVELMCEDDDTPIIRSASFTSSSEAQFTEFYGRVSFDNLVLEKKYTAHIIATDSIYAYNNEVYTPNKYVLNIAKAVPTYQWNGENFQVNGNLIVTGDTQFAALTELRTTIEQIRSDLADFGNPKVLWSGGRFMIAAQTAALSEKVSEQTQGIVLVWSAYSNGGAQDWNFFYQFVPKNHVTAHNGKGINTGLIATETFGTVGSKYVYVYDEKITGNDYNDDTGTRNGITYNNAYWVLRYVLGV